MIVHSGLVELGHELLVEYLVEDYLLSGPIGDAAAIDGKDISAEAVEFELVGQRSDAVGRTAGSEDDLHSHLLSLHQHLPGMGRDLFLAVGQSAIEVKNYCFVFHTIKNNNCCLLIRMGIPQRSEPPYSHS